MNNRPIEPLDAEERELAALLGRVGPHGEPSPALDAKILAAAHGAVARGPARAPARRRRWPALAGLAASVLIAAGIGWQLLPRHEASMQVGEAPARAVVMESNAEAADAAVPAAATPAVEPIAAPEVAKPASAKAVAPAKARPLPSPAEPAVVLMREAPPVDVAEPRATGIVTSLPTPPAPPAPPAPAPEPSESAPLLAPAAAQAQRAFAPAAPAPTAARNEAYAAEAASAPLAETGAATKAVANDNATLDSVVVSGSRVDETDVLGIEVEADTRLSKRAWLQRIELRRMQGDTDGARESLRLFVKKYPRATLSPDLRDLLKE